MKKEILDAVEKEIVRLAGIPDVFAFVLNEATEKTAELMADAGSPITAKGVERIFLRSDAPDASELARSVGASVAKFMRVGFVACIVAANRAK